MSIASNPDWSGSASREVDGRAMAELEAFLTAFLRGAGGDPDLAALRRIVRANPIEAGPLAMLGTTPDEADLSERLDILARVYPALRLRKDELRIGPSLLPETFEIYIPMARFMATRAAEIRVARDRAAVFGINGGQGSGKTTINGFLQIILADGLGRRVAGFSIDDVYKTYDERQTMARTVHPLFATRSVAGTHDTSLAIDTLDRLTHAGTGEAVAIPRFDKMAKGGEGDRMAPAEWLVAEGPLDVVVFEGWMVGAQPQAEADLAPSVNAREARDDPDGIWRATMNHLLATDYRELFSRIDELFVIEVRSMADVLRNRELQEQHLRRKLDEARRRGEDVGGRGAMSPQEVIDFISLYERTTRHMLASLSSAARLTLQIGDHHRIERLRVNAGTILP